MGDESSAGGSYEYVAEDLAAVVAAPEVVADLLYPMSSGVRPSDPPEPEGEAYVSYDASLLTAKMESVVRAAASVLSVTTDEALLLLHSANWSTERVGARCICVGQRQGAGALTPARPCQGAATHYTDASALPPPPPALRRVPLRRCGHSVQGGRLRGC